MCMGVQAVADYYVPWTADLNNSKDLSLAIACDKKAARIGD